jgi:hypothetical protein
MLGRIFTVEEGDDNNILSFPIVLLVLFPNVVNCCCSCCFGSAEAARIVIPDPRDITRITPKTSLVFIR